MNKFKFYWNILIFILDAVSTIEPRNGGCEPRVICEEVPVDRTSGNNVISYPQCLEVHRCGGCCQEPQFPCVPVRQESITFSPVNTKNLIYFCRYFILVIINFFGWYRKIWS